MTQDLVSFHCARFRCFRASQSQSAIRRHGRDIASFESSHRTCSYTGPSNPECRRKQRITDWNDDKHGLALKDGPNSSRHWEERIDEEVSIRLVAIFPRSVSQRQDLERHCHLRGRTISTGPRTTRHCLNWGGGPLWPWPDGWRWHWLQGQPLMSMNPVPWDMGTEP